METTLMTRIVYILGLLFFTNLAFSQELIEVSLNGNPVLVKKYAEMSQKGPMGLRAPGDTLSLPANGILDDFSYQGPYPDANLWLDDFVYINRGYAKAPITVGVATFDGMNNNGTPYDWAATTTSSAPSDELTSKPIDLSTIPVGDTTVYLSFYYQVQGIGNDPETKDSLVVEFKEVGAIAPWRHIWSKQGSVLPAFDSTWKYVMLPIRDPAFLGNGFQFRFRNYATRLGNLDHWHIDYVYLNRNRYTATDTTFEDVTFVYELPSLLNGYSAMPWRHYNDTVIMKNNYSIVTRNNHSSQKFVDFYYNLYNGLGTQVYTTTGPDNMDPYDTIGYYSDFMSSRFIGYNIPLLTGPENYTMQCVVNSTPDFHRQNDTIEHIQEFAYHYAYDDGSAESAVGAFTSGATIELAQKFTFTIDDTLRYVDIYFNPIVTNASYYTFKIKVWNGGGSPGSSIFTSADTLYPAYYGAGTDIFIRYPLSTPLFLTAGDYYVGLLENTNWFLNVGLDKNSNSSDKVFYNAGSGWNSSPFSGSLMMRPVFGTVSDFVGVNEQSKMEKDITIYPNPASDVIFFRSELFDLSKEITYQIMDMYGRTVDQQYTRSASANVSNLANGIYFIRLQAEGKVSTHKFILSR